MSDAPTPTEPSRPHDTILQTSASSSLPPAFSSSFSTPTAPMLEIAIGPSILRAPLREHAPHSSPHGSKPFVPTPSILAPLQTITSSSTVSAGSTISNHPGTSHSVIATPSTKSFKIGRKSKAHVASACINCKRAHLSCDVERPCSRCVACGKQDTCFDVQHKKRGRPRLREESEHKDETMLPKPIAAPVRVEPSRRTQMTPKHRRTDSYRSLRSLDSENLGSVPSPGYGYPSPSAIFPPPGVFSHYTGPDIAATEHETPTAFLNLDLFFIRANHSFRQAMMGGRDVVGRNLSELAILGHGESLQEIRDRLRAERKAREPNHLPPIILPGQEPLEGVHEAAVEQYVQGFDDRTIMLTRARSAPAQQAIPFRMRLAKANSYFVAVTILNSRPPGQLAPQNATSHSRMPPVMSEIPTHSRESPSLLSAQFVTSPAPRARHFHFYGPQPQPPLSTHTANRTSFQAKSSPRSLPAYQPQHPQPHKHPQPPPTPRHVAAEVHPTPAAAMPLTRKRELPPPQPTSLRRQPLEFLGIPRSSPGAVATSSAPRPWEAFARTKDASEKDASKEDEQPWKRLKLAIGDVLQR